MLFRKDVSTILKTQSLPKDVSSVLRHNPLTDVSSVLKTHVF